MPNFHRGEIAAEIGGGRRRLVLTLGRWPNLKPRSAPTTWWRSPNGSAPAG